jgi:hypothetical protein
MRSKCFSAPLYSSVHLLFSGSINLKILSLRVYIRSNANNIYVILFTRSAGESVSSSLSLPESL